MEHTELLEAARAGDREAQAQLLEENLGCIQALVRLQAPQVVRLRESHVDLVQSTCRRILASMEKFAGSTEVEFRAWLYAIARAVVTERLRYHTAGRRHPGREVRGIPLEDSDALILLSGYAGFHTPSQQAAAREEVARVEAALDRIPSDHKDVIVLAYVADLSRREIGERMSRSEEAVRQLLVRARARLATELAVR